jgi:hypothetical protein
MNLEQVRICAIAVLLLTVAVQLAATRPACAQELTGAEKARAVQYLETTKKEILEATHGLSPAQWNFKPAPERWSIAEVMEHIATAEDFIRGNITDNVLKAPAPDMTGRDNRRIDDSVVAMLPDRSHKISAPEPLKPANKYGSPEETIKHFVESRAKTEALVENTADLRRHATDSPMGVKLDGYQWLLLIAGHSERHLKQMLEVKADPHYPKA